MYILEKIIKAYFKITKKEPLIPITTEEPEIELEDVLTCKHNFMPIDSTEQIFACSKCGYLVTKKRLNKNNNFFKYQ